MYRRLFLALLALWMAFPVILYGEGAQDAVTFLVGGDLFADHPDAVYPGDESTAQASPEYVESFCSIHPPIDSCRDVLLVFSSPPQSLPVLGVVQLASPDVAILALRVAAAAALALGMWLLWQRLHDRAPNAPRDLFVTTLLLTPFAADPVALGQNTPLLFLLVCLGTRHTRRTAKAAAVGGLWVLATAFKAFPFALGGMLAWQRRWKPLAIGLGALAALTALAWAYGGTTVFTGFIDQLGANNAHRVTSDVNGSLDAVLQPWFPSLAGADGMTVGFVALRVLLLVPLTWVTLRLRDPDTQFAFASLAILVLFPFVIWHYVWLGVASVAMALAEHRRPDQTMRLLPLVGALVFAAEMVFLVRGSVPVVIFGVLAVCGAITLAVADRSREVSDRSREVSHSEDLVAGQ